LTIEFRTGGSAMFSNPLDEVAAGPGRPGPAV
jgi:hypothetical protein